MKYAYHTKWCDKWHCGGANNSHYSVISAPTMSLSHHLVWYAYFTFFTVYTSLHCELHNMCLREIDFNAFQMYIIRYNTTVLPC